MKGDRFPPEIRSGDGLLRITSHPSVNHPTYFLQSSFTPDGRHILFTSYRTGAPQLFSASLPDGDLRQLTDGAPIHPFSPAIHPDGTSVFFVRGGSIWTLDFDTLAERQVAEFPGAQLGECSLTPDGTWITAMRGPLGQGLVIGRSNGHDWRYLPFERTVIHPQFHPLDPEWLIFAGDPAPRMFRMRRNGTALECLHHHGNEEFVVHETFLGSTGDIVFVIWPYSLNRLNWHTREISTIATFNAWHIASNRAGTQVLCDTNHPDLGLFLIDVATGAPRKICESLSSNQGTQWRTSRYAVQTDFEAARSGAKQNLSWMEAPTDSVYGPQWTHPHPSFSHDEQSVAFASDRTGQTQVYISRID